MNNYTVYYRNFTGTAALSSVIILLQNRFPYSRSLSYFSQLIFQLEFQTEQELHFWLERSDAQILIIMWKQVCLTHVKEEFLG